MIALAFLAGLAIGGVTGLFVAALMVAAKKGD